MGSSGIKQRTMAEMQQMAYIHYKKQWPWLFEGCNRLNAANRNYILNFLLGRIARTPTPQDYDILLNEEETPECKVMIIFRLNTGTLQWKKIKKRVKKVAAVPQAQPQATA